MVVGATCEQEVSYSSAVVELVNFLATIENNSSVILHKRKKKRSTHSNRGSEYRGVSRNGRKWQVSIVLKSSGYLSNATDRTKFICVVAVDQKIFINLICVGLNSVQAQKEVQRTDRLRKKGGPHLRPQRYLLPRPPRQVQLLLHQTLASKHYRTRVGRDNRQRR